MKVYIVTYDIGGGYMDNLAVYSKRELAQQAIDIAVNDYTGTKFIEREKFKIEEKELQRKLPKHDM